MIKGELTDDGFKDNESFHGKLKLKSCEIRFNFETETPLETSREKNTRQREDPF